MGFGSFGKWLKGAFNKVKTGVEDVARKIGGAAQKVIKVAKPYVGMVGDAVSAFNPTYGQAIKTGFSIADGVSAGLSQGGIKGGIAGGLSGAAGSISNRGREPPEVWQDDDDDD
jgi:hypothetical protein